MTARTHMPESVADTHALKKFRFFFFFAMLEGELFITDT